MTKYWFVDGMMYPFWASYEQNDYPKPGETTTFYHNKHADTDMGDLYGDEFPAMFPHAIEITEEEFNGGMVHQ